MSDVTLRVVVSKRALNLYVAKKAGLKEASLTDDGVVAALDMASKDHSQQIWPYVKQWRIAPLSVHFELRGSGDDFYGVCRFLERLADGKLSN